VGFRLRAAKKRDCPMPKEEIAEYRRRAQECRAKAAKAMDSASRFELLTMASSWEILAHQAEKDEQAG
jgi:hypothetical protein